MIGKGLLTPKADLFYRGSSPTPGWTGYNVLEVFAKRRNATKGIPMFLEFRKNGSSASTNDTAGRRTDRRFHATPDRKIAKSCGIRRATKNY
jgi:hypothetical protein